MATSSGWRTPVGVLWGHQEARKERENKEAVQLAGCRAWGVRGRTMLDPLCPAQVLEHAWCL